MKNLNFTPNKENKQKLIELYSVSKTKMEFNEFLNTYVYGFVTSKSNLMRFLNQVGT